MKNRVKYCEIFFICSCIINILFVCWVTLECKINGNPQNQHTLIQSEIKIFPQYQNAVKNLNKQK